MYIYTAISDSVGSYYRDPAYSLKRVSKYRKYTNLVQNLKVICSAVKPMRLKKTQQESRQTGWHLKRRPPPAAAGEG